LQKAVGFKYCHSHHSDSYQCYATSQGNEIRFYAKLLRTCAFVS